MVFLKVAYYKIYIFLFLLLAFFSLWSTTLQYFQFSLFPLKCNIVDLNSDIIL